MIGREGGNFAAEFSMVDWCAVAVLLILLAQNYTCGVSVSSPTCDLSNKNKPDGLFLLFEILVGREGFEPPTSSV